MSVMAPNHARSPARYDFRNFPNDVFDQPVRMSTMKFTPTRKWEMINSFMRFSWR